MHFSTSTTITKPVEIISYKTHMIHEQVDILIVDDQPRNLDVLEVMLEPLGCTCVRAQSADEALLAAGLVLFLLMNVSASFQRNAPMALVGVSPSLYMYSRVWEGCSMVNFTATLSQG